jgi:hypothetical protein
MQKDFRHLDRRRKRLDEWNNSLDEFCIAHPLALWPPLFTPSHTEVWTSFLLRVRRSHTNIFLGRLAPVATSYGSRPQQQQTRQADGCIGKPNAWLYWNCLKLNFSFRDQESAWEIRHHIVRANPFELDVDDLRFYDFICATNKSYDKMLHFQYRFNVLLKTFSTSHSDKHRIRRAVINLFFSKIRFVKQNAQIKWFSSRISCRLSTEYAGTCKVLDVADMCGFYMVDVTMNIVSARSKNFSAYPNFQSPFPLAICNMSTWAHATLHFDWIITIKKWLQNRLVKILFSSFKHIIEFRGKMTR